ncbi:MAG: hypothetical protein HUJ92_09725, partial [Bacteroidales bacterium]|nr:hypothetical protein [Bacteroidales bacterium]
MPFTSQTIRGCSGNAVEALLTRLENKVSIGELLSLKAAAQGLSLTESQYDADEIYTYDWALNPAEVTKLLAGN